MISPMKADTRILTILIIITITLIIIKIIITTTIILLIPLIIKIIIINNNIINNHIYGFTCFSAQGQNRRFRPYPGKYESGKISILELL